MAQTGAPRPTYVPAGASAFARTAGPRRRDRPQLPRPAGALGVRLRHRRSSPACCRCPVATSSGQRAPFVDALFTATSAVCVTGLVTVDTATYWSGFGQVVILVAIKVGGLGVITLAALLGLAVSRRLGLTGKLLAPERDQGPAARRGRHPAARRHRHLAGDRGRADRSCCSRASWCCDETVGEAAWHAVFYAISAFNNAGFVSHPGGLPGDAVGDWWLCVPLAVGVFVGSVGLPGAGGGRPGLALAARGGACTRS